MVVGVIPNQQQSRAKAVVKQRLRAHTHQRTVLEENHETKLPVLGNCAYLREVPAVDYLDRRAHRGWMGGETTSGT
jgi:hypothetical protein